MSYYVRLSKAIRQRLRDLPGNTRNIAQNRVLSLAEQPRPPDAKELEGHPGYYRVWIATRFRLVWQVIDEEMVVDVLYVGPKLPDLYDRLGLARPSTETDE
jgi:mRNA interferase RelE/StbE